jgi:PAS domain S-box-containing protein
MTKTPPCQDTAPDDASSAALRGLIAALDKAGTAAVVFDPEEKLLCCTEPYLCMNEDIRQQIVPGVSFLELCDNALGNRSIGYHYSDAWLADKYRRFKSPAGDYDELHGNGRWYRMQDHRTSDGYYIGLRYDISEERDAASDHNTLKKRFETLAGLGSDFFWEMDADLRFTAFSGRGANQAYKDAIGQHRWNTATASDLQDVEKWTRHQADLEAHRPFRDFVFEIATEPSLWACVSGEPVFDDDQKFTGYLGTTSNITAQRESEIRYRQLVDGSVQGIIVHAENRPVFANKAVAQMLGYSLDEFLALDSLDQLFTRETRERHNTYRQSRMKGETVPEEYETEWVRKDGKVVTIRQMSQRIEWSGKQAIQSTIVDITDQKLAEAAMGEGQRRLRLIADGLPINVVYVDMELRFRFVNNAYLNWYGCSADEVLGKCVEEVMGGNAYKVVETRLLAALQGYQQNFETKIPFLHAGTKLVQTIYLPHIDDGGEVLGIYGLVIDISSRKAAEQAFRDSETRFSRMLAIAPDAIVATDEKLIIKVFNTGAENIFKFSSQEAIGQPINILLPERFHDRHTVHVDKFLRETADSRMMSERSEIFGRRKDGTEFPAEASISKLQIGKETVLTVMLHDISERKQFETDLVAAKEKAEFADRAKSEFLANMSHELRTPLNAIIGFADLMNRQTFGPLGNSHYQEYSDGIFESGDHLLSLINDILDISKIEAGRVEVHDTTLAIVDVVQNCLRIINSRAHDAEIQIITKLTDRLPLLRADERHVKQMLLNLLSNSVKFTEVGGSVTVEAHITDQDELEISVRDTGIGIAEEDIPKALMTFGQVDGALNRRFEGTGLGLPLVKSLIELHGGKMNIQSAVGAGTTVTLVFPASRTSRPG